MSSPTGPTGPTAPSALSLLMAVFGGTDRLQRAFTVYGAMAPIGGTAGVFAGGLLTQALDWRWVFWVTLPLAAAATTLVLWASAFVGIRHLGPDVPPGTLSLVRLLVMLAALLVLMRGRLPRWPTRAQWPLIALGGASWFGVYNLALNESERRIDAGTAALVVQLGPILVGLLAAVFLGERAIPEGVDHVAVDSVAAART